MISGGVRGIGERFVRECSIALTRSLLPCYLETATKTTNPETRLESDRKLRALQPPAHTGTPLDRPVPPRDQVLGRGFSRTRPFPRNPADRAQNASRFRPNLGRRQRSVVRTIDIKKTVGGKSGDHVVRRVFAAPLGRRRRGPRSATLGARAEKSMVARATLADVSPETPRALRNMPGDAHR